MDNHNPDHEWVTNQLALLDPPEGWRPDANEAYAQFRKARPGTRTMWTWAAAAAALLIVVTMVFPPARAVAERMLQFIRMSRLEVIRVDVDDLPPDVKAALTANIIARPGNYQSVASVEEASRAVGFPVRLPRSGLLSGTPELSTLRPLTAQLDLNVDALRRGLDYAGVRDLHVPDDWRGMRMIVFVSSSATAAWPGVDITMIQSLPVSLSAPPSVQIPVLTEIGLRILGTGREAAKRLAVRMAANPGIFLAIPQDEAATISEVTLRMGTGTLIHSLEDDGSIQRTELIWGTSDRLYALSGKMTDELAIAVANSVE